MEHSQILKSEENIRNLSEDELQELLVKLFKIMCYTNVEKNCGTQEYGKDIFFTQQNEFDQTNYSCVIKIGDISHSTTTKIIEQIQNSFDVPANTKNGKFTIQKVIVITNGVFKQNSKHIITNSKFISTKEDLILFWDINDLVKISLKYIPTLVISEQSIQLTEYKEKILTKLTSFENLKFLQTDFGYNIDKIEDFEIKCRTRYNSIKKEKNQYLDEPTFNIDHLINLSDEAEIFSNDYNYLITGIPTSGKTSFLKRIGRKFLVQYPDNYIFYFELNKIYSKAENEGFYSLFEKTIQEIVSSQLDLTSIKDKKCLVLLDGFDEVPNDEIRAKIICKLIELKHDFPKCQIIITSRDIEYIINNPIIDVNFEKYELLPLNIDEFIKIGEKFLGNGGTISEYINLVKKSDLINAFPKTPLTSILLCILFKEKQINVNELPANITELYKKFLDLFLNKWDASKGLSQQYKFQQKEFILQSIAKSMHNNNLIYIDKVRLKELLNELKLAKPIEDLKDTDLFVKEIEKSTNIFRKTINNGKEEFSFFHLTIQEYLASIRLKNTDEQFLIDNFYNDWWLNPVIFYTGKEPDNSSLISRLAKLENYPIESQAKIKYIVNSSLTLTAAHLVDNNYRKELLKSMIKIFDELVKEVIASITLSVNNPLKYKTILDLILDARNLFYTRFKINSFYDSMIEVWEEFKLNRDYYTDITQYCFSYNLSLKSGNEDYLLEFLDNKNLNVRWFKIVNVDIEINKLKHKQVNNKIIKKIERKVHDNVKYVNEQFKQPLKKHINSLLDINEFMK